MTSPRPAEGSPSASEPQEVRGTRQSPPPTLPYPTRPEQLPEEFRALRHFVGWRWVRRVENGAAVWTKLPLDVHTGRGAKANDPATWAPFPEAVAYARKHRLAGVGIELTPELGIVGVDLDKCRDPQRGVIEAWALEIVRRLDTYTQVSVSGRGLHLFLKGQIPAPLLTGGRQGRRTGPIEVYQGRRFLTLTTERVHAV